MPVALLTSRFITKNCEKSLPYAVAAAIFESLRSDHRSLGGYSEAQVVQAAECPLPCAPSPVASWSKMVTYAIRIRHEIVLARPKSRICKILRAA
jgi:hypothetical protein